MSQDQGRPATVPLLKAFAPLEGMKAENLHALAKKITVRTMGSGRVLFKEGESDKRTFWLVKGMVELRAGDRTAAMIKGEPRRPVTRSRLASRASTRLVPSTRSNTCPSTAISST